MIEGPTREPEDLLARTDTFLAAAARRVDELAASAPLDEGQRDLLFATLRYHGERTGRHPFANPLLFFALVCSAEGARLDERAEWLGAFCLYYVFALDLLDDVQDDDLAGKPHSEAGAAVAINSGLTLFALALAALHRAIASETEPGAAQAYLELLTRTCLRTSAAQHRDLTGVTMTPDQVLATHRDKTSSIALVIESAARHARIPEAAAARYQKAAQHMAVLVQLIGDVRDIFGKEKSPDLLNGKATYPLTCFRQQTGVDVATVLAAQALEPTSVQQVRALVYDSGAVKCSAEAIEQNRRAIHAALAGLGKQHPALRFWLFVVDEYASAIYVPPALAESSALLQPDGKWSATVRDLAAQFARNLSEFGAPAGPVMMRWHLPQWMYVPKRKTVFYPDLEGQADAAARELASLLKSDDLVLMRTLLVRQAPVVMAHELFHHWRHVCGRLTTDSWYEELVANRLAAAYVRHFHRDLVAPTLALAAEVMSRHSASLSPCCRQILDRVLAPNCRAESVEPGYGVGIADAAIIQLSMIPHLFKEDVSFDDAVDDLLGGELSPPN